MGRRKFRSGVYVFSAMVGLVFFGGERELAFSQTSSFCSNNSDCGPNGQCRFGVCFTTAPPDKTGTGVVAVSAPEPGTLLLVGAGFAGLVAWRKRKTGLTPLIMRGNGQRD